LHRRPEQASEGSASQLLVFARRPYPVVDVGLNRLNLMPRIVFVSTAPTGRVPSELGRWPHQSPPPPPRPAL
jgi:hypothetical protein